MEVRVDKLYEVGGRIKNATFIIKTNTPKSQFIQSLKDSYERLVVDIHRSEPIIKEDPKSIAFHYSHIADTNKLITTYSFI